jgi:hypothetical protein
MRISAKTSYERYSKTKLPFLTYGEDGTIMNGHWDVTETKEFLEGIRTPGRRLKDYLVYRPIPKAILALRDKPDVHPESYEMLYYTKLMKVMKEGIYIGQNTTILCFVLGDHVYFEIPVYDDNGNPMEGFETGRPLYSTIDRYILICFERYKLKSTPLLWVEGYW